MDKDGESFAPSLVRVGVKSHHSVASVSLDTIIDCRLGGGGGDAVSTAARGVDVGGRGGM